MKIKKCLVVLAASMLLASCGGTPASSNNEKTSEVTTSEVKTSETNTSEAKTSEAVQSSEIKTSEASQSSEVPATKYTVTATAENGSVTLEKNEYEAGETVAFTVTANEGYEIDSVTSSDVNIAGENGSYSFVMPEKNVAIVATFKAIQKKYKINSVENLTPDSQIGELVIDQDKEYLPGESVTLKIMPSSTWSSGFYYTNRTNVYVHINDELYIAQFPEDEKDSTQYVSHWEVTFTMPEEDVDIAVVYNAYNYTADNGHKVTIQTEGGVKVYGFDSTKENYTSFVLYLKRPESTLVTAEYSLDDGETWQTLEMNENYQTGEVWSNNVACTKYVYGMLTADCIVKITAEHADAQKITYEGADDIVTTNDSVLPEDCMPGDLVKFTYKEADANNYTDPATVEGVETSSIRTNTETSLSFTMPNNPVTIKFNVSAGIVATVEDNKDVLEANLSRSSYGTTASSFKPGSTVYLNTTNIKLRTGKMVSKVYMNDVEMSYSTGYMGNYYYGTAPESGTITIKIVTATSYKVVVNTVTGGSVYVNNSISETTAGTTVSGTIYTNAMYTFSHFEVKDALDTDKTDDLAITVTAGSYNTTFSFVMPEYDVYLTPVFEQSEGYSVTLDLSEEDTAKLVGADQSYSRSYITSSKTYQSDYFPRQSSETAKVYEKGEKLGVTLNVVDSSSIPQVKWTAADGTETLVSASSSYANTYGGYTSYTFSSYDANAYTINSATTMSIVWTVKTKAEITVENDVGATLVYKINGTEVAADSIMVGDKVNITATGAPDGKAYVVTVYDAEGNVVSGSYGNYTISGAIKIVVTEVTVYTFSLEQPEGAYFYPYAYDASSTYYYPSSNNKINAGTTVTVYLYNGQSYAVNVSIKVGDTVVKTVELAAGTSMTEAGIEVTDNLTLVVTAAA